MNLSFYSSFLNNLANQESQISTLQQEISTGSTVQTAAQNPAAFETTALANDQINQLNNDSTTQSTLQNRLGAANSAYSSIGSLLDNVQSIIEQGLNGTSNSQNLNSLAEQVQSASQQLLSLGNTQLADGTYLFGGTRGNIPPFQTNSDGSISYYGDSGQSQANIDGSVTANALVTGEALTSALAGDGTSTITADSTNTGTAQIAQTGLSNTQQANAFQASSPATGSITISFTNTNGKLAATATQNGKQTNLPLNTSADGQTDLTLDGMNFKITGSPKDGDRFTIAPARPQTAFALLQQISTALSDARDNPAQTAQTDQILNQSLAGLEQYQQSITTAQAQNGVTLQAVTNAQTNTSAQKTAAQTTIDNASAVNMPAAITALNQTMTAMEAAMKTFSEVQGLSLFKYL